MADPNRKTKQQRMGDQIDARIKGLEAPPKNYSQWGGGAGATGTGSGSGDATTDSTFWLRQTGSVAASGGTLALDFVDSSSFTAVLGFIDFARASYHEAMHFTLLEHSSSVVFAAGLRTRLPSGTDPEYTITDSLASGNIRLTFTNNHASEVATVTVLYALVPA